MGADFLGPVSQIYSAYFTPKISLLVHSKLRATFLSQKKDPAGVRQTGLVFEKNLRVPAGPAGNFPAPLRACLL